MVDFLRVLGREKFCHHINNLYTVVSTIQIDSYQNFCELCSMPESEGGLDMNKLTKADALALLKGFNRILIEGTYQTDILERLLKISSFNQAQLTETKGELIALCKQLERFRFKNEVFFEQIY